MTGPFFLSISVFVQPFVKRFALCYWTVVPSVCPVCDVDVLWPNDRMKLKLGMPVGLGPGYIVLDGNPAPQKEHSSQFSAHICRGQMAG